MRVEVDQRQRPLAAQRPQDRQGHRMIAARRQRDHAGLLDMPVDGLDVFVRLVQAEAAAHRHVADVGHAQLGHGRAFQDVVVRADALDRAQGARPEATAAAVAGAQVHRHAQQRDLQVAEFGPAPVHRPGRRVQQRGHAGIGRHARAAIVDHIGRDGAEMRIVDLGLVGAAEALAQRLQFSGVKVMSCSCLMKTQSARAGARAPSRLAGASARVARLITTRLARLTARLT